MSRMCRNCLKPAPRGPSRFCLGHPAVGEGQRPRVGRVPAHLPVRLALLVAGRAVLDDQVRDLVVAGARGDRTWPEISVPALVMNCFAPSITHSPSSSVARVLDVAGVRAGLGLGEPEGAELASGAEIRQQPLLLLVGAEEVDRLRAERGVGAQRDRDRGVDPGQLLDRERVGERVAAAAAVLLRERDPHQAELAHLRDELVGERLGPVELLGDRRDLVAGEVADRVAQQPLLV